MLKLGIVLTICLLIAYSQEALTIDLTKTNKYGNQSIFSTPCNKDTQIDFIFNTDSKLVCGSGGNCSPSNLQKSSMKFMDVMGNDLELELGQFAIATSSDLTLSGLPVNPEKYLVLKYATADGDKKVVVVLPVVTTNSTNGAVINIHFVTNGQFGTFPSGKNLQLIALNYLNTPDYSKFYHIANSAKKVTFLISTTLLLFSGSTTNNLPAIDLATLLTPDYAGSGDKLCYGSNQVQGLFQTHLRESWPLWTWMISIMLYWLYYLLSESETNQCYDKKFENNKMTCWGFYSLHYLGNLEYFSRLSRVSLLYFVFSFQAMVLSALYSTLGDNKSPYTNYQMIIWTAVIAFGASLPIPYFLGGIFLRGIYDKTLQKFRVIKKSRGTMIGKNEQAEIFEHEVDNLEESLYSYYFFYYIIIFAGVLCFWIPSIYMMMQISRQWYYLHRIWLASLAITFVLDNLIFDPILSAVLGSTKFYQLRGYFYEFVLGQEYKQIEE